MFKENNYFGVLLRKSKVIKYHMYNIYRNVLVPENEYQQI